MTRGAPYHGNHQTHSVQSWRLCRGLCRATRGNSVALLGLCCHREMLLLLLLLLLLSLVRIMAVVSINHHSAKRLHPASRIPHLSVPKPPFLWLNPVLLHCHFMNRWQLSGPLYVYCQSLQTTRRTSGGTPRLFTYTPPLLPSLGTYAAYLLCSIIGRRVVSHLIPFAYL